TRCALVSAMALRAALAAVVCAGGAAAGRGSDGLRGSCGGGAGWLVVISAVCLASCGVGAVALTCAGATLLVGGGAAGGRSRMRQPSPTASISAAALPSATGQRCRFLPLVARLGGAGVEAIGFFGCTQSPGSRGAFRR